MCRKKVSEDITINAKLDGVWVGTVVFEINEFGEYQAQKFDREFVGTGVEQYLIEDVEFWKSKGYEVVVHREP